MTKKSKKEVNSVPYTKAGLLNEAHKNSNEKGKHKENESKETTVSESTPKTGKDDSTKRDEGRPIH